MMDMDRARVLLKAAHDLLKKQSEAGVVLDLLSEEVHYDDAYCDGLCLMTDIANELEDTTERVPVPMSANMAHAMANLGLMYLRENAPERLMKSDGHLQTLEDLYRWMSRAQFVRPSDETKAAEFAAKIKEMLGNE